MTSRITRTLMTLAAGSMLLAPGCADGGDPGTGSLVVSTAALYPQSDYFRVRIFRSGVDEHLDGDLVWDTKCLQRRENTYEIKNLEVGDNRFVLVELFAAADCADSTRVGIGYRGGIDILAGDEQPYYHVPVFAEVGVTGLPADLNLSSEFAVEVDFCDTNDTCVGQVDFGGGCYKILDDSAPDPGDHIWRHWCAPTCTNDDECHTLHPQAQCEAGTSWCVVHSPYPVNLAEAHVLGAATTAEDGNPVFVGGFTRQAVNGDLLTGTTPVERYDHASGLFEAWDVTGGDALAVGMAGVTELRPGVLAIVGGVRQGRMHWNATGGATTIAPTALGGDSCAGPAECGKNLQNRISVFDANTGDVVTTDGAMGAVVSPAVLTTAPDEFMVFGGWIPIGAGDNVERSNRVWTCSVAAGSAACTQTGTLTVERAGAAALCIDEVCKEIVVIGGNVDGTAFELVTRSIAGESYDPITVGSLPTRIHGPALCGTRLVGGGAGKDATGGIKPVQLSFAGGVTAVTLEGASDIDSPVHPTIAMLDNGDCWVIGGVAGDGTVSTDMRWVTGSALVPANQADDLERARFGAVVAPVKTGPVAGSFIISGGLTYTRVANAEGDAQLVHGAEIFRP